MTTTADARARRRPSQSRLTVHFSRQDAGFTDVKRLHDKGVYSGPVIFYTGRITPAREARAQELHALGMTNSPDRLQHLVVLAARRRGSS
ncbi:hypothetical protein RKE29_20435 [Streptomyces sp. B1866]|uniref:hypothetical protein n=1 Tax=Streptomyces sp. B1866 TaxID=3075431 RepID=UPI00288CCB4A|nr:hypothetical protein [Streptomyces sp. B1866]MDT3398981.1 hypothetical protein [Streptomyces sp. B1866]